MIDKLGVKWVEINLGALARNIREIKRRVSPARIMAVVKADAYGHGAVEVAREAVKCGVKDFGVSCLEEAIDLRRNFIRGDIVVLGAQPASQICDILNYELSPSICTEKFARGLSHEAVRLQKRVKVHVCVDTGMGRVGPSYARALPLIRLCAGLPGISLTGVYSHFATADSERTGFALMQQRRFEKLLRQVEAAGIPVPLVHIANSGGVLNLPRSSYDMVRTGLILYGIYPCRPKPPFPLLRNVLTFKTRVAYVQRAGRGFTVGYGCRYVTRQETDIVTLPVGYADGFSRRFSNRGEVLIRGRRLPVVGSVCMDMIMVDAGRRSGIREGDEAVIIGRQGGEEISVYDVAQKLGTIPYEVICAISHRVTRVYLKGGRIHSLKRMIPEF